jgi:GxxExxY protein
LDKRNEKNAKNAKFAKGGIVMTSDEVAKDIVDAALKVHRALGPGLLESAYQACLAHELGRRRHQVETEVPLPLEFEKVRIEAG